jgi:hypothetical protein
MKRIILAVTLIICAFFGAYGQNSPIDLVLLLDTSSSMASSYENVNNYITGSFLSEFLRVGDTFHLIAFSGNPRLDAARRVSGVGDVETIIGRMLLQFPVESGNNIGLALFFTEQYIASLPARPKKIVIVSTGGSDTANLVGTARQRLSSRNITIDFIQVTSGQPLSNLPSSGRTAAATRTTQPSQPAAQRPASSAAAPVSPSTPASTPAPVSPAASTPSSQSNSTSVSPPVAEPPAVRSAAAQETPSTSGATNTADDSSASQTRTAQPNEAADTRDSSHDTAVVETTTGTPPEREQQRQRENGGSLVSSIPLIIGIIILALLILGLIIFFASRKLGSSPNRVMYKASSSSPSPKTKKKEEPAAPFADHSKELANYAAGQNRQRTTPYADRPIKMDNGKPAVINPSGPLLLNLFVEDQNTGIGKRNIHSLKSGYSLSIGGGSSDFLIFLVPIPPNIGEIHRNGSQCTFIPKKPKYFPDIGSNEVRDCVNKTIRIISDRNYELRFRFEMYEDPLIALNRLLMSVNVPG